MRSLDEIKRDNIASAARRQIRVVQTYVCNLCGEPFGDYSDAERHYREHHADEEAQEGEG